MFRVNDLLCPDVAVVQSPSISIHNQKPQIDQLADDNNFTCQQPHPQSNRTKYAWPSAVSNSLSPHNSSNTTNIVRFTHPTQYISTLTPLIFNSTTGQRNSSPFTLSFSPPTPVSQSFSESTLSEVTPQLTIISRLSPRETTEPQLRTTQQQLEPQHQPRDPSLAPVGTTSLVDDHNTKHVVVFVGDLGCTSNGHLVCIHATHETLFSFASRVQVLFAIPVDCQNITVLSSPCVLRYCMKSTTHTQALSITLPTSSAILVCDQQSTVPSSQQIPQIETEVAGSAVTSSGYVPPLRVGRYLKAQVKNADRKQDPFHNQVRNQVTAILNDRTKQVSLDILARITDFSKSSLSLWRRDVYNGNNTLVTVAISNALKKLEECGYRYDGLVHDGSCAVAKRKVVYKNPRRNKHSNTITQQ